MLAALLIAGSLWCRAGLELRAEEARPDSLPMFGQPAVQRPEHLKKADEALVRQLVAQFGSREAASRASVAQGWAALRARNPAQALRHFNEGWLLDPENPQVFWGFGAVMSGRGKLPQAIEYLETAREHWSGGEGVVPLLADLGTLRSAYAASLPADRELERAQAFISANQSFAESLELNPDYARSWREWALSLYDQGRFSEAWLKAGRAQDLKADPFPADFLSKLKQKVGESK